MSTNRLVNLLIAIALVALAGLTVLEVSASSAVIAGDQSQSKAANAAECESLPARSSIHTVHEKGSGAWLAYSEDGPTGIDGGFINLLSNYRTCSR